MSNPFARPRPPAFPPLWFVLNSFSLLGADTSLRPLVLGVLLCFVFCLFV